MEDIRNKLQAKYGESLSLNFIALNETVGVVVDGFFFGMLKVDQTENVGAITSASAANKYYTQIQPQLIQNHKGKYVVVTCDDEVFVGETESSVLKHAEKINKEVSFSGMVGQRLNPVELPAIQFAVDEMPNDFNDLTEFESPAPVEGLYINSRRWLRISIPLLNHKFRRTYFLVDTGAPRSYIMQKFAQNVECVEKEGLFFRDPERVLNLFGLDLNFCPSEEARNPAIRNINLVGTNFIDNFRMIDDKVRKRLMFYLSTSGSMVTPVTGLNIVH
jgi:hypothetical protein